VRVCGSDEAGTHVLCPRFDVVRGLSSCDAAKTFF
jgi:hypothetical protein